MTILMWQLRITTIQYIEKVNFTIRNYLSDTGFKKIKQIFIDSS